MALPPQIAHTSNPQKVIVLAIAVNRIFKISPEIFRSFPLCAAHPTIFQALTGRCASLWKT